MSRGSPPRVRGKLADFSELFHAVRITPACAGKTLVRLSLSTRIKDHPRVCGENTNGLDEYIEGKGSPPRVRGKQTCLIVWFGQIKDHPRVCGENI